MNTSKKLTWNEINWKECETHIKKLQEAIFRYKRSRVAV